MDGSLLFPLLRSVSIEKRPALFHFIGSTYTNPSAHTDRQIRLVQTVFESLDLPGTEAPDNQKVFASVFGGEQFDARKLEKLRSVTLAQIKRFIADDHRKQTEPEVLDRLRLAAFLRINGQYDLFASEIRKIEKQIRNMPESIEKMHCIFMKEYEIGYMKSVENTKRDDNNIPRIVQALDHFYLSHRLHYELSFRQQQQFSNLVRSSALFDSFPIDAYYHLYSDNPVLIRLYTQLGYFFRTNFEDHQAAVSIFEFVQENESLLSKQVVRECLTCLINFYTHLINQGRSEYYQPLFRIQQAMVEKGLVYYMDKIHAADFQAIVTIGLRLNELDWTWTFILNNQNRILNKRQAVEMLRYIHACYYFEKKDYKNTSRCLKETFDELQYKTAARILELKLLYESRSPELVRKLNAAKVYFHRDAALPPPRKKAANKLVDYIKQLIIPGTFSNKTRLHKLQDKLKAEMLIAEKLWLTEILSRKRIIE